MKSKTHVECELEGLEVFVYRSPDDGRLVVDITGDDERDENHDDSPGIRIWLNEALIYDCGETGDNLDE